ncbi:MAG: hypothetical protein R6U13_07165 [Desulfatiglandaceae bacterium]
MIYTVRFRKPLLRISYYDYDNDNLKPNKGCGGGFDAGDSSLRRGIMREISVKEPKLASESPPVVAHLSRLKTAPTEYCMSSSWKTTKYEAPAAGPPAQPESEGTTLQPLAISY